MKVVLAGAFGHLGAQILKCLCAQGHEVGAADARSAAYVDGLLTNGGPSTDVFKKKLGADATAKLFKEVLFGTGRA